MRVLAKVNENRIEQVKPGMPCTITIDAFRGITLSGRVDMVSDYPLASVSRYTAHIKEYATEVLIHNPPKGIRSGMSAKVTILSECHQDVLQIPLSAVIRKEGLSYCLVRNGEADLRLQVVELGSPNLTHAVLLSGLTEGDEVVVNPDSFPELFDEDANPSLASR
jgi:multidrug efflux pump subunit AcrA (membrane-fusion protein)